MSAARARRRWMAWQRYVAATGTRTANPRLCGLHTGLVLAFEAAVFSARVRGIRDPWILPGSPQSVPGGGLL